MRNKKIKLLSEQITRNTQFEVKHKMLRRILLLVSINILTVSHAWNPSSHFPSCLMSGTTTDQATLLSVLVNITTPELCQASCADYPGCASFTWLSAQAPLLSLTCALYSSADQASNCDHCVSGGHHCPCTVPGQCVPEQDNLIDVIISSKQAGAEFCQANVT